MRLTVWMLTVSVWLVGVTTKEKVDTDIQEFCNRDVFGPECKRNEVILITHARYGRMRKNSCLLESTMLGCSIDARDVLDSQCSGRHSCHVLVVRIPPQDRSPCRDQASYLEVSYTCVKVAYVAEEDCRSRAAAAATISEPHGYLSSLVTEETYCGSYDRPWWISAKPGQRLRFHLLNFSWKDDDGGSGDLSTHPTDGEVCQVYAVIKENAAQPSSKTICAGHSRERLVYTSISSKVEVRLVAPKRQGVDKWFFLLEYKAVECPEPKPPARGWARQLGSVVQMGCNGTNNAWRLECKGTQWVGITQSCTGAAAVKSKDDWDILNTSHGVYILVILGISGALALCILVSGSIYIKRNWRTSRPPRRHPSYSNELCLKQSIHTNQDTPMKLKRNTDNNYSMDYGPHHKYKFLFSSATENHPTTSGSGPRPPPYMGCVRTASQAGSGGPYGTPSRLSENTCNEEDEEQEEDDDNYVSDAERDSGSIQSLSDVEDGIVVNL